jgi:hypothetical protein
MLIHLQRSTNNRSHSRTSNNTKRDKCHSCAACTGRKDIAQSGGHVTDGCRGEYAGNESSDQQTGYVPACCASDAEKTIYKEGGEHAPFSPVGFTYRGP